MQSQSVSQSKEQDSFSPEFHKEDTEAKKDFPKPNGDVHQTSNSKSSDQNMPQFFRSDLFYPASHSKQSEPDHSFAASRSDSNDSSRIHKPIHLNTHHSAQHELVDNPIYMT